MASEGHGSVLTEISFENFCRFKKATFVLDKESTSLLGENGRGKTTVLQGIELFATLLDKHLNATDESEPKSFEIPESDFATLLPGIPKDPDLLWNNTDCSESIKIEGKLVSGQQIKFEVIKGRGTVEVTCSHDRSKLKQIECPTVVSISNTGVFVSPFRTDGQKTGEPEGYEVKESQALYRICVDNRRHVEQLLGLESKKNDELSSSFEKKEKEISSLLKDYGIREKCEVKFTWTKGTHELQINVIKQDGHHDLSLPLSRSDAGLQQVIIIMLMVLYVQEREGKKPMHLLLDEPVALFHGNLVRKLLTYLKEEKFCVVLACHAVDTLLACNRIISLDDDVPHILRKGFMKELGTLFRESDHTTRLMKISKALGTKCILAVENETDADVLKAWIKKIKGIDIDDKIVVHGHGGRPTCGEAVKLVGYVDKLFHQDGKCEKEQEKPKVFILTDRDYKAKMALEKERDDLLIKQTKNVEVKWYSYEKRNEMENYFLSAPALKSFLEEKDRKRDKTAEKKDPKRDKTDEKKDPKRDETAIFETKLKELVKKHCHAFSIRDQYVSSVKFATSKEGKGKLRDPEFNKKTEEEPKEWLKQPSFSFTDAKEVLKELGVELESQSYTRIIHHFPEDLKDIDDEIKDLVDEVLCFFNIVPTGEASAASTSSPKQDDSASSGLSTETPEGPPVKKFKWTGTERAPEDPD